MASSRAPENGISGGCLCEAIRYQVTFHEEGQWPPRSDICQCTMCRKFTASLFPQMLVLHPSQISPPLSSFPTYQEYESSPRRYRGSCGKCSSPLTWRSEEKPHSFDLFLGTIDEKWLVGERVEGTERNTPHGVTVERQGGLSRELCIPPADNCYYENTIPGVADMLPGGQKFLAAHEGRT
ncbi:hypothetical protein FE257_001014 [Aspergillus nanangensis]|uniref:CENP-V/GFA domain-containing protein n=1 Tax=Aspergillus nanangensis TaxID=2582783 RepID=A0AAD4CUA4_ASPNN|nr:hypothetical protein FE257_001014 [Aspergillus nanangensis]